MLNPIIPQDTPTFPHRTSRHLSQSLDLAHWQSEHHWEQAQIALADAIFHLDQHLAAQLDRRRLESSIPESRTAL